MALAPAMTSLVTPGVASTARPQDVAFRPERVTIAPHAFTLDLGEACWCNLGKDCTGSHEITVGDPIHVCGECGEEFKIDKSDPHWSTGRGPICPKRKRKS